MGTTRIDKYNKFLRISRAKRVSFHEFRCDGFTMIEAVVILTILTAISAMVLFNFSGFNEGAALNRSERDFALAIRKAQNMSLAVRRIETQGGPITPQAVGVRISTTESDKYFLFADLVPRDNRYNDNPGIGTLDVKIGQDEKLERNIRVNSLKDQSGNQYSVAHIIFVAPEATVVLSDSNGTVLAGDKIEVEFVTPTSQQKTTVVVRTSGQVSVK